MRDRGRERKKAELMLAFSSHPVQRDHNKEKMLHNSLKGGEEAVIVGGEYVRILTFINNLCQTPNTPREREERKQHD